MDREFGFRNAGALDEKYTVTLSYPELHQQSIKELMNVRLL